MATEKTFDCGLLFSGRESGVSIRGWDEPNDWTPGADPSFIAPDWFGDVVVWFAQLNEPLYIFGPTGCGKTSCVKQVAARLNYPVYEVTGHNRLEFPELVGHHVVKNGNMEYDLGPLSRAMMAGGLFLLNEIDLLDPSTAAGLNSVLDGAPLTIPELGGLCIKPHPMFKFVATANSNGSGDATGLYQGVLRQNIAFQDRFILCEAGYLRDNVEKAMLARVFPQLPEDIRIRMVEFANAIRRLFVGDAQGGEFGISDAAMCDVTFSTRSLRRWAKLTLLYKPLQASGVDVIRHALDRALLFRAAPTTKVTLAELYQRIFATVTV